MTPVMLISTNGTGLGHLTRSMAIARRMQQPLEPMLLTMSSAVPAARAQGFFCEHFPSAMAPGPGLHVQWEIRLESRLGELFDLYQPEAVVFDGVAPYQGLIGALGANRDIASIWCRRPLWRPGTGKDYLPLGAAFDAVIEPGELAAAEDQGLTVERREEAIGVEPILFLDEKELLPRQHAAAELELDPARPAVLVQLGAGGPEIAEIVDRCVYHLAADAELQVVVLESAIHALGVTGPDELPKNVSVLRATYPIARLYRAFDFAISASGYNAFHELVQAQVPTLWLPQPRQMDDQEARARYAEEIGAGICCPEPTGAAIEQGLDTLLNQNRRAGMREALRGIGIRNGAADAARAIAEVVS